LGKAFLLNAAPVNKIHTENNANWIMGSQIFQKAGWNLIISKTLAHKFFKKLDGT
jgi:hypothetical protein